MSLYNELMMLKMKMVFLLYFLFSLLFPDLSVFLWGNIIRTMRMMMGMRMRMIIMSLPGQLSSALNNIIKTVMSSV